MSGGWLNSRGYGNDEDDELVKKALPGASVPIQNRFIHSEADKERHRDKWNGQSEPARVAFPDSLPQEAQLQRSRLSPLSQQAEETAATAASASASSSVDVAAVEDPASGSAPGPTPVKNTFIHFDDDDFDEQPDYNRRTVSGPATHRRLGCQEPAWVPSGGRLEEQSTATPSDEPEAAAPDALPLNAQVKNTFIHFNSFEDVDQPDFKPSRSGPAKLAEMLPDDDEPAFVPLSTVMKEQEKQEMQEKMQDEQEALKRNSKVKVVNVKLNQSRDGSATANAEAAVLVSGSSDGASASATPAPEVKNTFIHFDFEDEEQPDYISSRSMPFNMKIRAQDPAKVLRPVKVAEELPSLGSSTHALGNCRPCAHIWKPGGCVKGLECTFCHLCIEDDFKRRRKEKLTRLKAEKAARKQVEDASAVDDAEDDAGIAPADEARAVGSVTPAGLPHIALTGVGAEADEPALGELVVAYVGDGASVQWAVDLKRLRSQHRCGQSRRFALRLRGLEQEVPFVFFLLPQGPDEAGSSKSSNKKLKVNAAIQIKCTDPTLLAKEQILLNVAFGAGSLPLRQAPRHDFANHLVCTPSAGEATWDLSLAAGNGATKCVVRAELALVRP